MPVMNNFESFFAILLASFIKRLPAPIKNFLFYKYLYPVKKKWYCLFDEVKLDFVPGIKMKLVPSDVMHAHIVFTGSYEDSLSKRVCELSRKTGGLMVDVGANVGYFTLLWLGSNQNSTCLAFEPSPRNIKLLKSNLRRNSFKKDVF
jgi:hypothetical protein